MRTLLITTAAAALLAAPAMAQDSGVRWSGSVGYSNLSADDGDLGAVTGRLGARFTPNFGIEGEASIGVNDEEFPIAAGGSGTLELDYDAAVYAVGYLPVSPNFEVFGRVGYGTTEIKAEAAGVTVDAGDESFNYGVGAQYLFDGVNGVRGDWTRRDFQDGGEADVWSLSYVRKF